jgi:hypothetical protein
MLKKIKKSEIIDKTLSKVLEQKICEFKNLLNKVR